MNKALFFTHMVSSELKAFFLFCIIKVSNVEEFSRAHLVISPVQTSQDFTPTTFTVPGWLWCQRAPLSSSPFITLSWSTMPAALTTISKYTTAYLRMRATFLGHFAVTPPHLSSPLPGMLCLLSSTQIATWPTGASVLATEKVTCYINEIWQWKLVITWLTIQNIN